MYPLDMEMLPLRSNRSNNVVKYIIVSFSILLGLLCLAGFIVTAIHWDLHSNLINECRNDPSIALCYLRLIIANAIRTQWERYIMVSLLLTYASVFFQIIIESNRTNVSGLLGLMIIQTTFIVFGIGVCVPILFLPSYIYFYKSKNNLEKSPVPIETLYIGLIYIICMIIIPTYLVYFLSSHKMIVSILSIILLVSPLGFVLISLPFRFFSAHIQRCWIINSHRLIVYCQLIVFIVSAPLFFITLVSLIMHWSFDLIKHSYVTEMPNMVNPLTIIWSIDYTSLLISLILFILTNEYLSSGNIYRTQSSRIIRFIGYFIFTIVFLITPCLVFPLYIAWKEYRFIRLT